MTVPSLNRPRAERLNPRDFRNSPFALRDPVTLLDESEQRLTRIRDDAAYMAARMLSLRRVPEARQWARRWQLADDYLATLHGWPIGNDSPDVAGLVDKVLGSLSDPDDDDIDEDDLDVFPEDDDEEDDQDDDEDEFGQWTPPPKGATNDPPFGPFNVAFVRNTLGLAVGLDRSFATYQTLKIEADDEGCAWIVADGDRYLKRFTDQAAARSAILRIVAGL